MFLLTLATAAAAPQTQLDELITRAKSFELDTPYVPPPGDPLGHHAAGYGKIMCSAVFMTGLAPDFAAENVGFFTAPYEARTKLGKPVSYQVADQLADGILEPLLMRFEPAPVPVSLVFHTRPRRDGIVQAFIDRSVTRRYPPHRFRVLGCPKRKYLRKKRLSRLRRGPPQLMHAISSPVGVASVTSHASRFSALGINSTRRDSDARPAGVADGSSAVGPVF